MLRRYSPLSFSKFNRGSISSFVAVSSVVSSSTTTFRFHNSSSSNKNNNTCCGSSNSSDSNTQTHSHSHSHLSFSHHGHSHSHSHLADLLSATGEVDSKNNRKKHENDKPSPEFEYAKKITLVGAAVNVVYMFLKIIFGSAGGSVALMADGLHAVVDVASDAIAYGSLVLARNQKLSKRCRFPFGLGRSETAGAVAISLILIAGAFSIAFAAAEKLFGFAAAAVTSSSSSATQNTNVHEKEDHQHHDHHHDHSHSALLPHHHDHTFEILKPVSQEDEKSTPFRERIIWSMLFIAASSIVAKEALYRVMKRAGERAKSTAVVANAYHHRADALSAALGLSGVVASALGLEVLDAALGFGVAAIIFQLGQRTLTGSVLQFFDYQAGEYRQLREAAPKTTKNGTTVNVFSTKHGTKFVLHATLLVKETAPLSAVPELELEIMDNCAKHGFDTSQVFFDVFCKVRVVDVKDTSTITTKNKKDKNDKKKKKKQQKDEKEAKTETETKEQEDEEEEEEEEESDFALTLREVAQFHGVDIDHHCQINGMAQEVTLDSEAVGDDCHGDIERVISLFNYKLILKN